MTTRSSLIKNLAAYIVPVVIVVVAYMAFKTTGQGEPPVRRKTRQVLQELIEIIEGKLIYQGHV